VEVDAKTPRLLILLYGIFAYLAGLAGLAYFVFFVGDWEYLPRHIDSPPRTPLATALGINTGLMLLFGVQHSAMARPSFKSLWTKVIPEPAERSTYVLLSGVVLLVLCWFWQPLDGTLWRMEHPAACFVIIGLQWGGWTLSVAATFAISHAELLGLRQVYLHWQRRPLPPPQFSERSLYRYVRHPIQLGVLIGLWASPTMSLSHLMLSAMMTTYILVGIQLEERDLLATLGEEYRRYRRRVPMLLPIGPRGSR